MNRAPAGRNNGINGTHNGTREIDMRRAGASKFNYAYDGSIPRGDAKTQARCSHGTHFSIHICIECAPFVN